MYKALFYMSMFGRYPNGISMAQADAKLNKDILRELLHYNYLEEAGALDNIRITVHGREALKVHVLTVANLLAAVGAFAVAVVALFK